MFFVSMILLASLIGCNYPGGGPASQPDAQYTQAAKTLAVQMTAIDGTGGQVNGTVQPGIETSSPSVQSNTPPATAIPTSTSTPPPTATLTQVPTPTENLKLLYSTDFSKETGWYTAQNDNFGFAYTDGGYEIYVNIVQANIWSIREQSYADVILEVNAERMAGPEDGYYGLMCRQVDSNNYYAFVIGSDGFYGIGKMQDGEFQFLKSWTDATGTIKQGTKVFNKIRADCIGDMLLLYVNGQRMIETKDTDFKEGVTGLIAGTQQKPGLQALFDDFAIYKPLG